MHTMTIMHPSVLPLHGKSNAHDDNNASVLPLHGTHPQNKEAVHSFEIDMSPCGPNPSHVGTQIAAELSETLVTTTFHLRAGTISKVVLPPPPAP